MTKFDELVAKAKRDVAIGRGTVNCTYVLAAQGKPYPRTCERCGLGSCPFYSITADTSPIMTEKVEVTSDGIVARLRADAKRTRENAQYGKTFAGMDTQAISNIERSADLRDEAADHIERLKEAMDTDPVRNELLEARYAFRLHASTIERDVLLHELTDGEIDDLCWAILRAKGAGK